MFGLQAGETVAFIPGFGIGELVLIFLIVLVIFGASKLPQLGRGLGEGISNFKTGLKGKDDPASLGDKKDNG